MNFEQFRKIVTDTRSVRRFKKGVTIPKEELLELIDLSRVTSSAMNAQPLKYIPIVDESDKEEVYKPLKWAAHLSAWNQSENEKPSAYILVINDTSINGYASIDSGIVMQTIMIGATTKGYSACILASIDKEAYRNYFKLEKKYEPMFIIALGIKDEEIKLVDIKNSDTAYYREDQIHCVPKRSLEEITIG